MFDLSFAQHAQRLCDEDSRMLGHFFTDLQANYIGCFPLLQSCLDHLHEIIESLLKGKLVVAQDLKRATGLHLGVAEKCINEVNDQRLDGDKGKALAR